MEISNDKIAKTQFTTSNQGFFFPL